MRGKQAFRNVYHAALSRDRRETGVWVRCVPRRQQLPRLSWLPVSLEHEGSNWLVTDTITPSAINSWVGEEVKVLGLEGKLETAFGEHQVALTGAAFVHDDMSGTLLSYRGWALHDVRLATNSDLPLPPLSASTAPYQAPYTSPSYEMQTAWRTRFWNLGAMAALGDSTTARSQFMWGNTLVGPDTPWGIPVDVDFTA